MKLFHFINPLKTQLGMLKLMALFVFSIAFSLQSNAQIEEIDIDPTIQSGIIQNIDQNNQIGIVQFKIENLDAEMAQLILREFDKYNGEIVGYGQAVISGKIIVSYLDPLYPNFLLAILDRVNIKGYYENNGVNVYYQKDGRSAFIR
jgi:hypothetical protein